MDHFNAEFCARRIKEQDDYIESIRKRRNSQLVTSQRASELIESATGVRSYFEDQLIRFNMGI
jgi:ppGpp synthetase/RelA/SpoT-type nucleotidyltranferase